MSSRYSFLGAGLVVFAASFLIAGGALAQDVNAQKNALAKAQFMLRQATSEKADLQQQLDTLKQQVEKVAKELGDTKSNSAESQRKAEEKFSGTIEQWKQHDAKSNEQLLALRSQLRDQTEQRTRLEAALKVQTDNFALCYGNNQQLFDLNRELLTRYQQKGVFDAVKQKEPFTGLKEVEIENLVQDYRYRNDDLKVSAPAAEPAPTSDTGSAAKAE